MTTSANETTPALATGTVPALVRQVDIENALRLLCRVARKDEELVFVGNDMVLFREHLYRTQEVAEMLMSNPKLNGGADVLHSSALLGFCLPPISPEDQLNVLCDILRQIKATDRHVSVTFDGTKHNIKMTYGNQPNRIMSLGASEAGEKTT